MVITKDGRFACVTNFISGTISSYNVGFDGSISLLEPVAAMVGENSQPEDMSLSGDGRFLYVLLTGVGQVAAFQVEPDGRLTPLSTVGGIPAMAGATGLAAF